MRFWFIVTALLLVSPLAFSQEATEKQSSPDLIVLKSSWARRSITRGWDTPLYSAAEEVRTSREIPTYQIPITADSFGNRGRLGPRVRDYEYKARVKNTGSKAVVAAIWEYIFI